MNNRICYLGADPGKHGAIVAIWPDRTVRFAANLPILMIPKTDGGKRYALNYDLCWPIFQKFTQYRDSQTGEIEPVSCFIAVEDIIYGGLKSTSAAGPLGKCAGALEAMAKASGMRMERVFPPTWQSKVLGKTAKGMTKEAAIKKAIDLFPTLAELISPGTKLIKDEGKEGIADAACMAEFCCRIFSQV